MALVVINGMSGQQAPHQGCNGLCAGFKQKMKVVGKQSIGIRARLSLFDQPAQPLNKAVTIFTVIEYFSAPDSASNDMVQSAGASMRSWRGMTVFISMYQICANFKY